MHPSFFEHEVAKMSDHRLTTAANRSALGIMNEFTYLGRSYRSSDGAEDLAALSLWPAQTPCRPLFGRHGTPDRALAALDARYLSS